MRSKRGACVHVVMFAALLALAPSVAYAEDEPAQALPKVEALSREDQRKLASLLELAEAAEQREEFDRALTYYEDAYELFPHPQLLYSIASCQAGLGQRAEAIDTFEMFLKAMPSAPLASSAREKLASLRAQKPAPGPGTPTEPVVSAPERTSLRVSSRPRGAVVYLNDVANGPLGTTPTLDLPIPPGTYRVILRLDGYEQHEGEVVVTRDEGATYDITLKPLPKLAEDGARSGASSVAPWIFLGVGVASAGAAVTFGVLNSGQSEGADTYSRNETLMYVFGAAAILSFTGAILLWATADDGVAQSSSREAPMRAGLAPPSVWISPEGGGVGIFGRF